MHDKSANQEVIDNGSTRRAFLGISLASGAALLAGGSSTIFGAASPTSVDSNSIFRIGGDIPAEFDKARFVSNLFSGGL